MITQCSSSPFEMSGGILVEILSVLLICYSIYLISAFHLHTTLAVLAKNYNLSAENAGILLLSLGGSMPELILNLIATLTLTSTTGLASTIGAAVYNLTFSTSVTCVCASLYSSKNQAVMDETALLRDCSVYTLLISILYLFLSLRISTIYTASALLLVYSLYMFYVIVCGKLTDDTEKNPLIDNNQQIQSRHQNQSNHSAWDDHPNDQSLSHNVVELAIRGALKGTIPDARGYPHGSFLAIIAYLSVLLFLLLFLFKRIGCFFNLNDTFTGLTFIAVGSSIPDTIICSTEALKGKSRMAISGLIGSSIFDLSIGMSVPWLISGVFHGNVVFFEENLQDGMLFLLLSVFTIFAGLRLRGMRIGWEVGIVPALIFVAFLVKEILDL